MGGGGFLMEPENPLLDDYILSLAGKARPKICLVPTASGDSDSYLLRYYKAFSEERADASHLVLFRRTIRDLRAHVLAQDIVFVSGGSTANMLAVWRVHGLDAILREAWDAGVVLAGVSAGMICWFEGGVTDSFIDLARLDDGVRFLPGSACPHYDGEPDRQPTYRRLILEGMPAGYAADDGAAILFEGDRVADVVSSRPDARAYHVSRHEGRVVERMLWPRYLGAGAKR